MNNICTYIYENIVLSKLCLFKKESKFYLFKKKKEF